MLLIDRVQAWRREFLRRAALEGSSRLLCLSACALILILWLDEAFSLPQPARWALLLGGLGAAAAGAHALLLRPWLSFDWKAVLDAAAREFPELRQHLVSSWELFRAPPSPYTSEELKAAHLERTEGLLSKLPARALFSWKPSRLLRRAALAAGLGGMSLPWLGGSASWERVLAPWRDVPLERFVQVSPGDCVVDWGRSVEISARWPRASPVGRSRQELRLWLKGPGGWRPSPWDKVAEAAAAFTAEELSSPLDYRLSWRDLRSRSYRLSPMPVPQLDSLRARVRGQEQASALNAGEPLSVLRGSWLTIAGRPNQPLAKAVLRVSSLPVPLPMRLLPSGDYEAGFLVQEDSALAFELESADGRRDPSPAAYSLKALPDEPPKAELLSPQVPLQASPADTLPVAYSARDDGGLTRISLLIRGAGESAGEILLQSFARHRQEFLGDYPWELSGLSPGKFEFQIKAVDNAVPPQSGLSEKGSVEIVDFETGHELTERLWLEAEEAVKSLWAREERVKALLSGRRAAELEAELGPLPEAWKGAVERFSRLSQAMEKDAYANPGLGEQARALSAELAQAQREGLPEALKSSRSGDWAQAQKRHSRLAELLKKSSRLLGEGKKLQGLQDFYTEAGRMSQTGEEIEAALEGLSSPSSAAVSSELFNKLHSSLSKLQRQMESLQKAIDALPKYEPKTPEEKARRAYTLPLNSAREAADALQQALAAGDFEAALRIARRLSEHLSRIQKAVGEAASDAASSALAREAYARMEKAQALWSEVIEDQTRVVELTQRLEEGRLSRMLAAQKELLGELSREQGVLVSSAAAYGGRFPSDVLAGMREVEEEFEAPKVINAENLLRNASSRLRQESALRPKEAAAWEWFASAEDSILKRLEQGSPAPPNVADSESAAARRGQGEAREKTARLQKELESIEAEVATLPGGTIRKVEGAQEEQDQAEQALAPGDCKAALGHEEAALSLLEQARQELSESAGGQKMVETGLGQPFSRPATGVRVIQSGPTGARTGFVPLPSAKDYLPPKEIREELEKSLHEPRPESYDGVIKEYFKRISQ